jgi:ribosomal protein L16 Arg81 hydroxylase
MTHSEQAERDPAGIGIARLIAPVSRQVFEQEYLDRKPLHVARHDPDYYADLITYDDFDRLLSLSGPHFEAVRVVSQSIDTFRADPSQRRHEVANRLEQIYQCYRAGSTIVLNSVNEHLEQMRELEHAIHGELSAGVEMNAYLTPGGMKQGFNPHFDTHDVVVLQVYGSKSWRLYGTPVPAPLPGYSHDAVGPDSDIPVEAEIELEQGDLLYLPRGTMHAATSGDQASAHLTIGLHRPYWLSLIQDALLELSAKDPRFRASLPPDLTSSAAAREQAVVQLRELMAAILMGLKPEQIVSRAAARTTFITAPKLRGHLADLDRLSSLRSDTVVYRRPGLRFNVAVAGSNIRIEFHNKVLELAAGVAPAVQVLGNGDPAGFTAADLPREIDLAVRLNLVATLLREGFLTFSPE